MDPQTFSTRHAKTRDQRDAWSEWFRPVFDVQTVGAGKSGFNAEYLAWQLGDITLTRVTAPATVSVRTTAHVHRSPVDHWVITYCGEGTTALATRSKDLNAPAGVPFVWSLGQPSESRRTAADRLQLYLPRDAFADVGPLLDAAVGSLLGSVLGNLLGDFLRSLEHRLPTIPAAEVPALARATRELAIACVAPSVDNVMAARPVIDQARLDKARQVICKSLYSPLLGPGFLCRALGVSRSGLYRLFDAQGGVARFIQRARLLAAHTALCDPACKEPVARIAERLCFSDVSVFVRAFRKEFGCTPRDVRAAGYFNAALSPVSTQRESAAGQFVDLLLPAALSQRGVVNPPRFPAQWSDAAD